MRAFQEATGGVPGPRAEKRPGQLAHTCTVTVGPTHTKAHIQWLVRSSHTEADTHRSVSHLDMPVSHGAHVVFRIVINTSILYWISGMVTQSCIGLWVITHTHYQKL